MKKIFIIPGLGETGKETRYQLLSQDLKNLGHEVTMTSPNWYKPLSSLIFRVPKNATIIGFSFGAILAYLIAEKFPCRQIILASMSPLKLFSYQELMDDYSKHMPPAQAKVIVDDIFKIKISLTKLATPHISLVGENEKEKLPADLIVPKSGHFIDQNYRKAITKLF